MSQALPVELVKRFCQASAEQFEFVGMIGQGGMGAVLCAHDRGLDRMIAIKLLLGLDARRIARFEREAQITANLDHPGIVRVHSSGVREGIPYIAYELVQGETFEQALASAERPRQMALIAEAARALGHAHGRGVLHRDVKPANILIDTDGRVRVADFGLATGRDVERLTQTNAILGTPGYMAPEQMTSGELGPGVDVWALGVILYESLCGASPFSGDTLQALMSAVARGDPVKPRAHDPSISSGLEQVCLKALRSDPAQRYPDGDAFADDLERALAGERVEAEAGAPALLLGLLALVLLALGAVAIALALVTDAPETVRPATASNEQAEVGVPAPADPTPVAQETRPPFSLELVALPPRPGLTAHTLRSLALVGDDLVTIEDPRVDSVRTGLRVHFAPGAILRTFDPQTLGHRRSVQAHTQGTGYMATAPGLVATGAADPRVRLWRLPDLSPAGVFPGHTKRVSALALSMDGAHLAVADPKALRLWRVADQTLLWKRRIGRVRSLAFLPNDGGLLVVAQRAVPGKLGNKKTPGKKPAGEKNPGKKPLAGKKKPPAKKTGWFLERWSMAGSVVVRRPAPVFWQIVVHPSGKRALTARWKPAVAWFWKLGPEGGLELERKLALKTSSINGLVPDRAWKTLLLATPDGRHARFEVGSRKRRVRQVGRSALYGIAGDGDWIYSGGADALVRRMSAQLRQVEILAPPTMHEGAVVAVGEKISFCDFPLHAMIPAVAEARLKTDRGPRALVSMSPAGQIVLAYPDQNLDTLVLKTAWRDDGVMRTFKGRASAVAVGRRAIVAMADGAVFREPADFASEWHRLRAPIVKTGARVKTRPGTFEPVTPQLLALAIDPREKRGFGAGEAAEILAWDLEHPASEPSHLSGHTPPVLSLAATEWHLFAGERGGAISVFRSGKRVAVLPGTSPVLALLALAHGTLLFAGSQDGRVRVWDVEARKVRAEAQLPDNDFARSIGTYHDHVRVGTQLGRIYRLPIPGS